MLNEGYITCYFPPSTSLSYATPPDANPRIARCQRRKEAGVHHSCTLNTANGGRETAVAARYLHRCYGFAGKVGEEGDAGPPSHRRRRRQKLTIEASYSSRTGNRGPLLLAAALHRRRGWEITCSRRRRMVTPEATIAVVLELH
nr:hypothetical protein Iba_chr03aCG21870 [Ipomoea batatas]